MKISVDDLLAEYLSHYISKGLAVRDALVQSISDLARTLGLPAIEMPEEQFEKLAVQIQERIDAHNAAKDMGEVLVAPGITGKVVPREEYEEAIKKN